jgi:hypothetical protein
MGVGVGLRADQQPGPAAGDDARSAAGLMDLRDDEAVEQAAVEGFGREFQAILLVGEAPRAGREGGASRVAVGVLSLRQVRWATRDAPYYFGRFFARHATDSI